MWESRYYVTLNITVDGCDANLTLNITVDIISTVNLMRPRVTWS